MKYTNQAIAAIPVGGRLVIDVSGEQASVPLSAVVESGSNANGDYTRFADGTQWCWVTGFSVPATNSATGSLFQSGSAAVWTFPVPFAGQPVCSPGASNATGAWVAVLLTSPTTASVRAMSSVTSATALGVRLMAVGRWF